MLKKIKKMFLQGPELAKYYEDNGDLYDAYKEYLKLGNHLKAGEIMEKSELWHDAAKLYISQNEIDRARRAIEKCFKQGESWETFKLQGGRTISIEDWLKKTYQTRRFVTDVKFVEILDDKGTPLIFALADKLKKVSEYKGAAELYQKAFELVNRGKDKKKIKNEIWLKYAAECYSAVKLYDEAAECLKELTIIEINIWDEFSKSDANPYRNYIHNLKIAKNLNILEKLLEIMGSFDPFNLSYDLLKIGEPELSIKLFFKFYGKILDKNWSDKEIELRNKRIQYCLNQYVIFYSKKGLYTKAGEIALLNNQKEIAADLFKKAKQEKQKKEAAAAARLVVEEVQTEEERKEQKIKIPMPETETFKCPKCGEIVSPDWEICPSCDEVLELNVCSCGQKIKPHWVRCPNCQKTLYQPETVSNSQKKKTSGVDENTKPFKTVG
jgi:tetratricopeptide (TPR) repeat protein